MYTDIFIYMIKRLLAKVFRKKLYKAEVLLVEDDFTAEYYSDKLGKCLAWTLNGLQEARRSNTDSKMSHTKGVYGRIMPLKVVNVTQSSIGIMSYKRPCSEDYLFMTDTMIHVPESVLKIARKEEPDLNFK